LPVVGYRFGAPRNMIFNTGHGSLGFTLAFGTATKVVQILKAKTNF
jgi:D-amino-acid dehydrogenase